MRIDLGIRVWALPSLIRYFFFFTICRGISNGILRGIMHKKGVHGQITSVNAALKQVNQNIYLADGQSL